MSDPRTKKSASKAKDIRQAPLADTEAKLHKKRKVKKPYLIQYRYTEMDEWSVWGRYATEKSMKSAFSVLTREDSPGLKYRIRDEKEGKK